MNWRKLWLICTSSYLIFYFAAVVLPRKMPFDQISSTQTGFLKKIFSQILYYDGPLEPVANFVFLIPVFAILLHYLGKSRTIPAVYICVALSASAELLQKLIPGRVSSLRDFFLNSAGAVTAYLTFEVMSRLNIIKPKI